MLGPALLSGSPATGGSWRLERAEAQPCFAFGAPYRIRYARVVDSTMDQLALNTAHDLAAWVRAELESEQPDTKHAIRVLTREIDRWFNNNLSDTQILDLAAEPAGTGDDHWTALIEGIVAHKLHCRGLKAPAWTKRTRLEVGGWDPYRVRDDGWFRINIFATPVELLDKGIVFPRQELELL